MALSAAASGAQAAEDLGHDAAYNGTATGTPTVNSTSTTPGRQRHHHQRHRGHDLHRHAALVPTPVAMSTSGNLVGASATSSNCQQHPAGAGAVNSAAALGVATTPA